MSSVLQDKIYITLQKNVKILIFIIIGLIVVILLLFIFRPSKSIPNSAYKSQIDSLSHEIVILQEMKKIQENAIKDKDLLIEKMEDKDSLLEIQYAQKYEQLKTLKTSYEKKATAINHYNTSDIKRAFSDLTD